MGSMVIEKAPTNKQKVTNRQLIILVLYLISLAIISTYPLIFSQYGEVYLLTSYGSLIAYFIMDAALIAIGVLGALVLGTGMSLIMTDLGSALGHWVMVIGILAGILGLILVALAYPIYNSVLRKERQRIAPEILRLSEELLR